MERTAELRLALAKEALRQAEMRLGDQAVALAALETRATAIVGWSLAGFVAAGAALLRLETLPLLAWISPGALAGFSAALCTAALPLLPGGWGVRGHEPSEIQAEWAASEADILEWCADGYGQSISDNAERLAKSSKLVRRAIAYMIAAPILGVSLALAAWVAGLV
jgi:hypothetical protein